MAKKLKVYRTSIGFFDLAVAAPSMKAAAEAWGSDVDIFSRGFAEQTDDPKIVEATLAAPGVVLRRPVGSDGAFAEKAALPKAPEVRKATADDRPKQAPPRRKPTRNPTRKRSATRRRHSKRKRKGRSSRGRNRGRNSNAKRRKPRRSARASSASMRSPRLTPLSHGLAHATTRPWRPSSSDARNWTRTRSARTIDGSASSRPTRTLSRRRGRSRLKLENEQIFKRQIGRHPCG